MEWMSDASAWLVLRGLVLVVAVETPASAPWVVVAGVASGASVDA